MGPGEEPACCLPKVPAAGESVGAEVKLCLVAEIRQAIQHKGGMAWEPGE